MHICIDPACDATRLGVELRQRRRLQVPGFFPDDVAEELYALLKANTLWYTTYNDGDQQNSYGFGGLNQLRGWEFREFIGSKLAWSNLELRFPLIDLMDFPFLRLIDIRGKLFLDVGTAWFENDVFYDPADGDAG